MDMRTGPEGGISGLLHYQETGSLKNWKHRTEVMLTWTRTSKWCQLGSLVGAWISQIYTSGINYVLEHTVHVNPDSIPCVLYRALTIFGNGFWFLEMARTGVCTVSEKKKEKPIFVKQLTQ
jgi:hypothetical protein